MDAFINLLKNVVSESMPGKQAQMKMMPRIKNSLDRFSIEAKKGAKQGAVLILLYYKNGKIYFPLTQRHEYDGAHSGQVSFPGGKVEHGDFSLEHTALRETEEEIGVPQLEVNILGKLTDLFIIASNFNVQPVIGFIENAPEFCLNTREVAEVIEISIDQLLDDSLQKEKEIAFIKNTKIQAPYFDFNGYHVWGATAMMLAEFKEILKNI